MSWEPVIGLEIHVQLATQSKIFSGAATTFGAEPNAQACTVDLGLPGVLPVVNQRAVEMALLFGLAIGADIPPTSIFARKNYFYPDLPKGYQISQYESPIVGPGKLTITVDGTEKTIGITRAHLEEDAGKSIHDLRANASAIDLNRAGTPLLEIVSEPEMSSSDEAVAYYKNIHQLVTYLDICDGDLSAGSMRCDVNVSVRPTGSQTLGTRTEIKNINSFRFVQLAIDHEIERHIQVLEQGGEIRQETRLFDTSNHTTRPMRSKEDAHDYRYFPDPDIPPIEIRPELLSEIKSQLPELPKEKVSRFLTDYQLTESDTLVLTQSRDIADYFEAVYQAATQTTADTSAKVCSNWVTTELLGLANQHQVSFRQVPIAANQLGKLIARITDNTLSGKMAKSLLTQLWSSPQDPDLLIESQNLSQISDSGALKQIVVSVIEANAKQAEQYRAAPPEKQKKLIGYFVGQVMKASSGQANPKQVNQLLNELL